ncbi:MAG: anti-sigma factor, partial [Bryobacteraceae bacterium]
LYELYVLGVLESEQAIEIDVHLRDECTYCLEHVRGALQTTAAMSALAEPVKPPKALRDRVLSSVTPAKRSRNWTFALAGLSAACVALAALSLWSTTEMQRMRQQLSTVRIERDELRSAIEVLTRSDTRAVQFGRAENVPHGRVLVNRTGGLVFVASQLPALPGDKTFELWLIPAKGAPQAAGVFRPNPAGESVHISPVPVDASNTAAVAVTVEPHQGSTAPTTKPILVVPLA